MDIQDKSNEDLIKELQELQLKHEALKVSFELDITKRRKAEKQKKRTGFSQI